MGEIRIGTSGYSFKDWRGVFYPEGLPDRDMLRFYSKHFDAVEINSTYYRIPSPKTFESMARKTPEGFEFTVKAHQEITHVRGDVEGAVEAMKESIKPLVESGKFGGMLLQFPYSFKLSDENVGYLRRVRDLLGEYPLFVEFRHRSWIKARIFELLRELGMGYCCVDEPRLRGLVPPVIAATSDVGYVRFHGRNAAKWWEGNSSERYDYLYSEEELLEWKPRIEELASWTDKTYVFFNNCHAGQAAVNAQMMLKLFGGD